MSIHLSYTHTPVVPSFSVQHYVDSIAGCNCSRDIIGHHIPTLVMALPLAIPLLWSDYWPTLRQFESTSFSILDGNTAFSANNEQLRTHFINSYTLASGFAYISSLNEVFMCFQRVEMSLQGVQSFRDISHMKTHIFTSKLAVFVELTYKLCFFWGISLFACKACCDFDKSLYDSLIAQQQQHDYVSTWKTLLKVYSSPAVLRGALFRAFSIVMYPSMGLRCYKKIKHLHRDLDGNGVKDVKSA